MWTFQKSFNKSKLSLCFLKPNLNHSSMLDQSNFSIPNPVNKTKEIISFTASNPNIKTENISHFAYKGASAFHLNHVFIGTTFVAELQRVYSNNPLNVRIVIEATYIEAPVVLPNTGQALVPREPPIRDPRIIDLSLITKALNWLRSKTIDATTTTNSDTCTEHCYYFTTKLLRESCRIENV